jgi:hypothetical protein
MCQAQEKDAVRTAMDDARQLAKERKYEEALAKHIWIHDHALQTDSSYYGVRLSYALADWMKLGRQYPPAIDKLKSIRDEKTAQLLAGKKRRELFHDVESINERLGKSPATVELFKKLEATDSNFAKEIYQLASDALVQAHEFALARKYMGDPAKRLDRAKNGYEAGLEYAQSEHEASRRAHESIFANEIILIITVLRETGDKAGAKDIQKEALKIVDNADIKKALAE